MATKRIIPVPAPAAAPVPAPADVVHQAAAALGRLGGLKGGKARAEKLSPETRRAIAVRAAQARWAKQKLLAPAPLTSPVTIAPTARTQASPSPAVPSPTDEPLAKIEEPGPRRRSRSRP